MQEFMIAFGILAIISILLIFNVDFGRFFPKVSAPITKNPYLSSFVFGFFFGFFICLFFKPSIGLDILDNGKNGFFNKIDSIFK